MRVMVLGATGFIGPSLVTRLVANGHEPLAASRSGAAPAPAVEAVAVDRSDAFAVAALVRARRIEAVVDLLAYTLAETAPLLDAFAGCVGRYVLASSGDVYARYGALHRKEAAPGGADAMDEDAPLRATRFPYRQDPPRPKDDPRAWMDDYDKIPLEAATRAQLGLEAAIVRLPMVFGPGDKNRRFRWAITPMLAGSPILEIDAGWAAWRTAYGYVEDVAEGLVLAATHPGAAGHTYNLAPEAAPDHLAWAERIAEATGWKGQVRTISREAVSQPLRSAYDALDLTLPFVTDGARIRRELGFRETVDLETALQRTIASERR